MFILLFCYVLYYTLRIALNAIRGDGSMASPVNPVLGTLAIVSLRFYLSMDNPYVIILAFLMGTRFVHKVARFVAEKDHMMCGELKRAQEGGATVTLESGVVGWFVVLIWNGICALINKLGRTTAATTPNQEDSGGGGGGGAGDTITIKNGDGRGAWMCIDIVLDSAILSVLMYTGIIPQLNHDPYIVALYVLQGGFAAIALNRVMLAFEKA